MYIDFSTPPQAYWKEEVKISLLQRFVLVHSICYYELNNNIITDREFDMLAKQLCKMQRESKVLDKTDYYYAMSDFTEHTCFDSIHALSIKDKDRLTKIAKLILMR